MKKLLFVIIIISIFVGCKSDKKEIIEEIAPSQLSACFENSSIPSAIMGHSSMDGKMKWYAFGPSVWSERDTVNENNIFRIYSMTKAITSVAAMQLVEEGLIGLDDPLNELMPEMTSIPILTLEGKFVEAKKAITLRHLLTHTAGFVYSLDETRQKAFDENEWTHDHFPRLFEAGEQWQYGTNLNWVGAIIEKVSGEDLETYFRKNITGPLKMNSTWFNVPENLEKNIVSWGARDSIGFEEYTRVPEEPVTYYNAGGGLFGSPKDYLNFLVCIMNQGKYEGGQILKSETIELMYENHLPNGLTLTLKGELTESDTHGLAWAIEDSENEMVRSKGSVYWGGAANSFYSLDNKKDVAIVYFTNYFPWMDKETYDFYRLFEKEVYDKTNRK